MHMDISEFVQPEQSPEHRQFTLQELLETRPTLAEGDIVTGLSITRDYDSLETYIVDQLAPYKPHEEIAFLRKPLASQLWPKKFAGTLPGTATVLSVDIECLNQSVARANFTPLRRGDVLGILIEADMYFSGIGIKGSVTRPALYWRKRSLHTATYYGTLGRDLGSNRRNKAAAETAAKTRAESGDTARKLAALGVKHALSGGLPEQGKK